MSKLSDALRNRANESNNDNDKVEVVIVDGPTNKPDFTSKYDRRWLNQVIINQRLAPVDDDAKVGKILLELKRRNGQCPCGGSGHQYRCPCIVMREYGICKCGLFKNVADRNIKGAGATLTIERNK